MVRIRKSDDRGIYDHGWLKTAHTFSFADYYEPEFMGFRALRVINDDVIDAGRGFGKHPHRDMEILTYILDGELTHGDSMGHTAPISAGEVQYMSAGRGVLHSEANTSTKPVHLLQIWIEPNILRAEPRYEQRRIPDADKAGKLALIASGETGTPAIHIRADAMMLAGVFREGESATHELAAGRSAWVHVARGSVSLNGTALSGGDGAAVSGEAALLISGVGGGGEVLVFDLA